jgi:predicted amidohydrolase YtcJ
LRAAEPADLIVHNAKVVTVDAAFRIEQAVAVKDGRVLAVGGNDSMLKLKGPKTRLIDAGGRTVLPGLYDSHVHPVTAALSELRQPVPVLRSLKDVFAHVRAEAARKPEGEWIIIRFAFPTRLDEGRFPTKAELDSRGTRPTPRAVSSSRTPVVSRAGC